MVTPDGALVAGDGVRREDQLAGMVVDDVVENDLRIARIECTKRLPNNLTGIDAKELDVGQLDDLAGLVDHQFGIGLTDEDDVRLPEDLSLRRSGSGVVLATCIAK